MLTDRYGQPISTSSQAARDAYVDGVDCVLSAAHGDQGLLAQAIEADPDFALAHAALARARFLMADVAGARQSAARARELATRATPREQNDVDALGLAIEGKPVEALTATHAHLAQHPRDAIVASPATACWPYRLQRPAGSRARADRVSRDAAPASRRRRWFQAVYAFALEEVGRLDEARDLIERSMEKNPWRVERCVSSAT